LDDFQKGVLSFTFPDTFSPTSERVSGTMEMEIEQYPHKELSMVNHYGIRNRMISLQGTDLDDNDLYLLLHLMETPNIKKLYMGDDYYYYVIGADPSLVRDESIPTLQRYTANFVAVDPYAYDSGSIERDTASPYSVNLSSTDGTDGYRNIYPIIWLDECGSDAGYIQDWRGCRLAFTPPSDNVWIIMPYFIRDISGCRPNAPIAYKYIDDDITDSETKFALDLDFRGADQEVKHGTAGTDYSTDITLSTQNTDGVDWNNTYLYPRADFGQINTFTISGYTGTVHLQWRYRR